MSRVTPVEWWWIFLRFDIWLCWMQLYVKKAHLICLSREPQNVVRLSSRMPHSIVCSLECKLHLIMLCPRLNFLSSMIMELYNCRLGKNVECFSASLSIIFVVKKKSLPKCSTPHQVILVTFNWSSCAYFSSLACTAWYFPSKGIFLRNRLLRRPGSCFSEACAVTVFCTWHEQLKGEYIYTGCFTILGHNCRRWFPRSLWSKKFI